jgi:SAM-dependent methyltransferase
VADDNVVGDYDVWHATRVGDGEPTPFAPWHELAKNYLGAVEGLRVLEIGCGLGEFTRFLAERGALVTGLDISPYAVDHARQLVDPHPNADVAVGDICNIGYPDQTFDLVVSLETIEHSPSPQNAICELVRVTKPGGRLIVTSPNYVSFVGLYRLAMRVVGRPFAEAGQPVNHWTTTVGRVVRLRRLGCRVDAVAGAVQLIPIPFWRAVSVPALERPQWLMRWLCLHGVTVATKLGGGR